MTVPYSTLHEVLGGKIAAGVVDILGQEEALSDAYDEPSQVVFSAIVVLSRKYMELLGSTHPASLLAGLSENLEGPPIMDALDLLSQQDEADEDRLREESVVDDEERRVAKVDLDRRIFKKLPGPVLDVASDIIVGNLASLGYTPDDSEDIQGLMEQGFLLAYENLAAVTAIRNNRYRCRKCNMDFGIELPFPENAPIHGDDGSGEGCDDGLISKCHIDPEGTPVWLEETEFIVVIGTSRGVTQGHAYFNTPEGRKAAHDMVMEYIEPGEVENLVYMPRSTVAASVSNAESFLTDHFKYALPAGVTMKIHQDLV